MAGIVLLVAIVASVVYYNRVRLLNQTLALLVEPFRVSVGEIDFYPIGIVRIENLELAPKQSPAGTRLALIPESIITYRLGELRATRRLENITLHRPEVYLDESLLKSLHSPEAPTTETTTPFRLSSLGLFTGALLVEQGRLVVRLRTSSSDWAGGKEVASAPLAATGPVELKLSFDGGTAVVFVREEGATAWRQVGGPINVEPLASVHAGLFTGLVVGPYAYSPGP